MSDDEDAASAADPESDRLKLNTRDPHGPSWETVFAREEARYGGVKVGAAFFGWLAATGMSVLLTALLTAVGIVFDLGAPEQAENAARIPAPTIGVVGGITLMVVLFIGYYSGGYVAGRMARFDGVLQGAAVWGWAAVVAVLLALIAIVAGSQYDILANLNSFPRIPLDHQNLTAAGLITAIGAALVTLGGALLGGHGGMRYHRRVDRVGLAAR